MAGCRRFVSGGAVHTDRMYARAGQEDFSGDWQCIAIFTWFYGCCELFVSDHWRWLLSNAVSIKIEELTDKLFSFAKGYDIIVLRLDPPAAVNVS